MADEITVSSSLIVDNGSFDPAWSTGSQSVDQAAAGGGAPGFVNIGTSEEAISFGDVSTPGWAFIRNIDATNYVDIGPDSGGSMVAACRLKPGEGFAIRLHPSSTWRGQANTAAVDLVFAVLED